MGLPGAVDAAPVGTVLGPRGCLAEVRRASAANRDGRDPQVPSARTQLAAEGLFAPERKKELPYLPEIIGVVTSPSGAVIRDILHRLRDRFPRKVLIWPVAVQGAKCAPEVARAIEGFNAMTPGGAMPRPDLLIVARGGGSVEDLWGFNEEVVARAIAASEAFSIAGGGDTLAAIDKFDLADGISYISTGGGAFLEYVEGKKLPAVQVLESRAH